MKSIKEIYKYYNQFPKWYWKHGLHDAKVLSISETELACDFSSSKTDYNCFEIELDSDGALFESDIAKISLYNYKLKSAPPKLSEHGDLWWIGDEIEELPNKQFKLDITFCSLEKDDIHLCLTFDRAEVKRK